MESPNAWRDTPRSSKAIFLLAVFFVFASFGVAGDVTEMGQQSWLRYVVTVVVVGAFSVSYAASGITLRRKFWMALIPLWILQFVFMGALNFWFPDPQRPAQFGAAETARLHGRLVFDCGAIVVLVTLGYVGFVFVSISEGRRYIKTQTEKRLLESEMSAAREVQRVMVPAELPRIAGYAVESVYRPAAEVGGDFFQVIPLKDGRALVAIGDVSGKGLRAAMIVSMIVGMLEAVCGWTEEPAEILAELNRRLSGRMHDGFVTCLAVRLEDGGRICWANAGHPAQYMNGKEMAFAGSMPLGMAENAAYEQAYLEMCAGDRMVLLTDGIIEAQNEQGLLGFGGVEALLLEGAAMESVADAAQRHGQNDDMTVISIAREV